MVLLLVYILGYQYDISKDVYVYKFNVCADAKMNFYEHKLYIIVAATIFCYLALYSQVYHTHFLT